MIAPNKRFLTVDYEDTLNATIRLQDCLPPDHFARFLVDTIARLDMTPFHARLSEQGGKLYMPESLLALLVYGYATGVFSSRQIERVPMSLSLSSFSLDASTPIISPFPPFARLSFLNSKTFLYKPPVSG